MTTTNAIIDRSLASSQLKLPTEEETMERKIVSPPTIPSSSVAKHETTTANIMHSSIEHHSGIEASSNDQPVSRGGVTTPFPWKLHDMLERVDEDGYAHIVSWQPHGRCFMIHKPKEFVELVKIYFNQTKLASFQRQLNLYGFHRLSTGRDKGAYYHEHFLRGRRQLCSKMTRQKVKGTKVRRAMAPALEPQFYSMPFMPSKNGSTEEEVMPSTETARRLMRTVSLENCSEAAASNQVCFFEGKPFYFFDKSMVIPPSECEASSLKRENKVIETWMTVVN